MSGLELDPTNNKHMRMKMTMTMTTIANGLLVLAALAAGFCLTSQADEGNKEAKLESKAKITKAAAQETALAKVPHGIVKESELEEEDGKLIWSFDIEKPGSQEITEVAVDAVTGKVVSVEKETPEEQAKEKAEDAKKKHEEADKKKQDKD